MAATPSKMVPLGTAAPDFSLPDVVSGKTVRLADLPGDRPLLVMFLSRHCPYVWHVKAALAQLGHDYRGRASLVAISANDASAYPEDAPERLRAMAVEADFNFPVCYDEPQTTARTYGATCTPDFFLYDSRHRLVYRGQLDDSRPGNGIPVTGADVRAALDALLAGKPVAASQSPSLGCNIKWR